MQSYIFVVSTRTPTLVVDVVVVVVVGVVVGVVVVIPLTGNCRPVGTAI